MYAGEVTGLSETRSADPFLGNLVDGRYKVESLLGVGTVGSVYRARDCELGGAVALKIWNASAHDNQTRGRFMREAMALSTLRHPHIVDIRGYGMFEALPYVAMEFLDGSSLEALLVNAEPLESAAALNIMAQILQALTYAHGLGVVHRDLKPENVVLVAGQNGGSPTVKLLDYGLAKFLSPDDDPVGGSTLTMTGMVMGTPLYMAPEQATGKSVDARVDVYAAGCLLFEMLSGRPPFAGDSNAELFRAHMDAEVPKLATFGRDRATLPRLQSVLEKALAKRPEHRYAHAGEMLEALLTLPHPALRRGSGTDSEPASGRAGSDRAPVIAALLTFMGTAAALAYALLR